MCGGNLPRQGQRKSGCKRKGKWMLKKWSIYLKITCGIQSFKKGQVQVPSAKSFLYPVLLTDAYPGPAS